MGSKHFLKMFVIFEVSFQSDRNFLHTTIRIKKMIKILLLLLLVSVTTAYSIESDSIQSPEREYINQDPVVDSLRRVYRQQNRQTGIQGYRIQIFRASGNRSKLLTEQEKAKFDAKHPNIRSYISYDEPYYRLRVGDFRSRLDAQRFLNKISSEYIYSIIVVDRINFPRLDTSKKKEGLPDSSAEEDTMEGSP